ncbi:putative amidase [Capsicum annuum]|nr:putative amidase [Capsicum annuum]
MATGAAAKFIPPGGYNQLLKVDGVKGKRIGIVREPFFNFTNNHALAHTFEKHLQALSVAAVLTIGGFPAISVPAAYDKGVPIGICFSGLKGSELKLIEIDYGFEQATLIRNPPYIFALRMYN